jgi:MFS transporter, MHS family, citrate/tricarballylate:H+ symporter
MAELAALAETLEAPAAPDRILKRHVAAAVIGNGLEFYDFITYATFAVPIAHTFFPNHSPFVSEMLSLATFGAGFIPRPIGAILIGRYADRVGRKPAMIFSFTLMGLAILGLALTPSFAQIGIAAPILAVTWRLLQGFALGGEVGPTTAFLVEAAPPQRRAFYAVWQNVSQNLASMGGGLVGVTMGALVGATMLEAWGWRVAFLLGAATLPVGFWLRRSLPETLHRETAFTGAHPERPHLLGHIRIFMIGLGLIAAGTVSTYVFAYMTTYAITTLHLPTEISLSVSIVIGVVGIVGGLTGALLSDRFGRRPLLIWPRLAFLLATWPAFHFMVHNHDAVTLLVANGVLAAIGSFMGGALIVGVAESIHKDVRGMGLGAVYATAVALFGGTTQPVIHWLIHITGDPLAPGWYMMAFTCIGLVASLFFKESAHRRINPQGA